MLTLKALGLSAEGVFDWTAISSVEAKASEVSLTNDAQPTTTSVDGLTIFKETSAEVKVDECVAFNARDWSNPFKYQVPMDLLKRSYQIESITWNTALATPIAIPLIGALALKPAMAMLLKLYRLIRCCFKLHFKIVASQYHQGSAMIGWLPCINWALVPKDKQSLSAYHATVISAAKKESLTITIPYCSPEDYFDTSVMTGTTAEHATVYFSPLNAIISTNATVPAVAYIEVWANIEDCDMSGAVSQSSSRSKKDIEAEKKERDGKDAAVGSVIRNTSQLVRKIPVVGAVWSPVADVINYIFGTELSKPVTVMPPRNMAVRLHSDVNQSDGTTDATWLSLYQNPRVKVAPMMFGMDTSFKSWRKYAGTPMLFDQVTFNGSTTLVWSTQIHPISTGADIDTYDYLAMAAMMFTYYRGSIKFLIHFCMPTFYSVRFRIRYSNWGTTVNPSDTPSILLDIAGDVWQTVTVPVLTFHPWFDPLNDDAIGTLYIEQLSQISGPPALSSPVVYCNIFRAGGEDVQFSFPHDPATWIGRQIKNTYIGKEEDMSRVKLQMNIREKFNEQFDPLIKQQFFIEEQNAVMAETVGAVNDLMKRHALYPTYASIIGDTASLSFHKVIAHSFMWQRGGLVYRHIHPNFTETHRDGWYNQVAYTGGFKYDLGWAPAYTAGASITQLEAVAMPYISATHYQVTTGSGGYVLGSSQKAVQKRPILNVTNPGDVTIAAGDDFCFLFQVPWANQLFVAKKVKPSVSHTVRAIQKAMN